MAWTNPRTWLAGETVTAALMNTHVRDNFDFWAATPHELWLTRSTDQTITTNTKTVVDWNNEDRDVGFGFSPTASAITVQQRGVYSITFGAQWNPGGAPGVGLQVEVTGLTLVPRAGQGGHMPTSNFGNQKSCSLIQTIESGQIIRCYVYHNNGSNMSLEGGASNAGGTRVYVVQVARTLAEF